MLSTLNLRALGWALLASALLANGVHLTGRSFKYHRPRGILTAGSEEPNALVNLGRNARLDVAVLRLHFAALHLHAAHERG